MTRTEHKTLNSLPEPYIIGEQWMNVVNFKCKIINQLQWWQKSFVTCHNLLSKTFKLISHAEQSVINYDFFFLLKWSYNYDSWILVLRNKVAFNSLRTNDIHKRTVNYSQLQKKRGVGRGKKYERECGSTLCEVSINESLTKAVLQLNFAWCPCDRDNL